MTQAATRLATPSPHGDARTHSPGVLLRTIVIGLTAFLTVVDLFATQAILPSLDAGLWRHARRRWASRSMPARWAWRSPGSPSRCSAQRIDRRLGILVSLALLAIPTALLAVAPDLATFTVLRVVQGLCMAAAFTLTLAYLGEQCSAADAGGAFAAYITGNVASNLVGRSGLGGGRRSPRARLEFLFLRCAQSRRRRAGLFHGRRRRRRWTRGARSPHRRSRRGSSICAIRRCAPPSASASASCSPSSAPSPTSISCWCARRCRSARWNWASSISCSCPRW